MITMATAHKTFAANKELPGELTFAANMGNVGSLRSLYETQGKSFLRELTFAANVMVTKATAHKTFAKETQGRSRFHEKRKEKVKQKWRKQ